MLNQILKMQHLERRFSRASSDIDREGLLSVKSKMQTAKAKKKKKVGRTTLMTIETPPVVH